MSPLISLMKDQVDALVECGVAADCLNSSQTEAEQDDVVARLTEYVEAGARTVILAPACPGDYVPENQRLLAERVLPAFTGTTT